MKYGLNYQGSKNAIAEELCDIFPVKTNFYDLFAGGGAVTHRMLLLGMFENYTMSDIDPRPLKLFGDCVSNNIPEPRWVSREEFFETRTTDGYAACCFCFGGDWESYLYSKEREPIQRGLHNAVVYDDFSEVSTTVDLSFIRDYDTWNERRMAATRVLPPENRMVQLERMVQLVDLASVKATSLNIVNAPYDKVEIKPNSILYCDPPYRDTHKYQKNTFDHEGFYDWCRKQKELTFISEYWMPDDFICIRQFSRLDSKAATKKTVVTERLYVPSHQLDIYNDEKTTLF